MRSLHIKKYQITFVVYIRPVIKSTIFNFTLLKCRDMIIVIIKIKIPFIFTFNSESEIHRGMEYSFGNGTNIILRTKRILLSKCGDKIHNVGLCSRDWTFGFRNISRLFYAKSSYNKVKMSL